MRIHYSLHGVRFFIEAEGSLAGRIAAAVLPPCTRSRGTRGATAFLVRAAGGGFVVRRGRTRLWAAASEPELIPWLESEIVGWLLRKLRRFVQLHAAVVERRGGAVVIAGPPDAGKTSLACALGLAGWGVMSDEVALVEPRTNHVLAFPRAMLVKSGTARRLSEMRPVRPMRVLLENGPESVRYVSPVFFGRPLRTKAGIRCVVFPEWARRSAVEPMGEREALERLLPTSFNTSGRPKRAVGTCVRLVRSSTLLTLRVGKLRNAARLLSEAVESIR